MADSVTNDPASPAQWVDTHLHSCPFKPGGRARELCAAACGFDHCTGKAADPVGDLQVAVALVEATPYQPSAPAPAFAEQEPLL